VKPGVNETEGRSRRLRRPQLNANALYHLQAMNVALIESDIQ
jgi:hypothetical protein